MITAPSCRGEFFLKIVSSKLDEMIPSIWTDLSTISFKLMSLVIAMMDPVLDLAIDLTASTISSNWKLGFNKNIFKSLDLVRSENTLRSSG